MELKLIYQEQRTLKIFLECLKKCILKLLLIFNPEFGVAMEEAKAAGAEMLFLKCHIEPDTLEIIEG